MRFTLLVSCTYIIFTQCSTSCDESEDSEPDSTPKYAVNPLYGKKLVLIEDSIANELSKADLSDKNCMTATQTYLLKYSNSFGSLTPVKSLEERAEKVAENPIHLLKMIYRVATLVVDMPFLNTCMVDKNETTLGDIIQNEFTAQNLTIPTMFDVADAFRGLLRIQYIYAINATDIQQGKLLSVQTDAHLGFVECLDIAMYAMAGEAHSLSYQWIQAAEQAAENNKQLEKVSKAWETLSSQADIPLNEIHQQFSGKWKETLEMIANNFTVYEQCRGIDNTTEVRSCYLDHLTAHPYFWLMPLKVEVISNDLPVLKYHDFFGDEIVDFLRQSVTDGSNLTDFDEEDDEQYISGIDEAATIPPKYVTIYTKVEEQYLKRNPESRVAKRLQAKLEFATGLVVSATDMHMWLFGPYGNFDVHHDSYKAEGHKKSITKAKGDRVAQFLLYLSDVQLGGNTSFTELKVHSKPEKGSAVFWFNIKRNSAPDWRAMHIGCPVVLGTKLAIRVELNEHENMWTRPCDVDPTK